MKVSFDILSTVSQISTLFTSLTTINQWLFKYKVVDSWIYYLLLLVYDSDMNTAILDSYKLIMKQGYNRSQTEAKIALVVYYRLTKNKLNTLWAVIAVLSSYDKAV